MIIDTRPLPGSFVTFSVDWKFLIVFPPIYISMKQEALSVKFHVHNHTGVLKIVNMNGNILQRYFTHKNF